MLICLALAVGAVFPSFFGKDMRLPWPFRLYMGAAALLGWGPALFGKGGAALYPVLFVAASLAAFSPLVSVFRSRAQADEGHSPLGGELASAALLIAGPQAFLQLLAFRSVAASSVPLFWIWAVPLILAALLTLWQVGFCLLMRRPFDGSSLIGGLLILLFLAHIGRKGVVEHYGVSVPGSFWEAPEYTTEAMARLTPYVEDEETGATFWARVGVKISNGHDSETDGEGNEHSYSTREAQIRWIEIGGIRRRIILQDAALRLSDDAEGVVVQDQSGKKYLIGPGLDFDAV